MANGLVRTTHRRTARLSVRPRRYVQPSPYSVRQLRDLLAAIRERRALRAKLPRDPVAWQRRVRADGHRSRQLAAMWKRRRVS